MKKKRIIRKIQKRRRLTVVETQGVRNLAEQIGKLISLEGYRSSFSLTTVAKQYKLSKFLPKKGQNKKETFAEFIRQVICNKPRTLKKIIREILPRAIEKRHEKGDPVLEPEAVALSDQLKELGIDLKKEINDLKLPKERPKIVPPPIAIQSIMNTFTLYPALLPDCKEMFNNGHINEAVRKALERLEKRVQDISGLHDKQGPDLMALSFSEKTPKIKINKLQTQQEQNEQIGFKFITMGIMHWWRNNLSHGDEIQMGHHDALGRMILISNLFHQLDQRPQEIELVK